MWSQVLEEEIMELVVGRQVNLIDGDGVADSAKILSLSDSKLVLESVVVQGMIYTLGKQDGWTGWKLLFPGIGGETCFNPRAPMYKIEQCI